MLGLLVVLVAELLLILQFSYLRIRWSHLVISLLYVFMNIYNQNNLL